jgi:hypothetical protein
VRLTALSGLTPAATVGIQIKVVVSATCTSQRAV